MVEMIIPIALGKLGVASTFVLETRAVAEQKEMQEICRILSPLQKVRTIGCGGNKDLLKLPLKRTGARGKRSKVVHVGTLSDGFIRNGIKALPDVIYLDWQFRLVRFLQTLPIDPVCKPHPGGYFRGQQHPLDTMAERK